jgi:hypothetical protein
MKLRWANLFVFSLVVLFFVLLVKAGPQIRAFLGMMAHDGRTIIQAVYRGDARRFHIGADEDSNAKEPLENLMVFLERPG